MAIMTLRDIVDRKPKLAITAGGATMPEFSKSMKNLEKSKSGYDQAKEEIKQSMLPTMAVLKYVDQRHGTGMVNGPDQNSMSPGPGGTGLAPNQNGQLPMNQDGTPAQNTGNSPTMQKARQQEQGTDGTDGNQRQAPGRSSQGAPAKKVAAPATGGKAKPGSKSNSKGRGISVQVKAGGPGSGRHPGFSSGRQKQAHRMLVRSGFDYRKREKDGTNVYSHPDNQDMRIDHKGGFNHGLQGEGPFSSLSSHLRRL